MFQQGINKPVIYKFFQDFTNHSKKTNRAEIFCQGIIQTKMEVGIRFWAPNLGLA